MENFSNVLNKVKEMHDKEVQGLQAKLTELTMEKCRDTRRIEELFAKNHLLREQQKALNENVKVLENRLRAGLCDRCTVTQELAKKKQQEYEGSHFQSLQLISSLTNELRGLKEENASLREKLRDQETDLERVPLPEKGSCTNQSIPLVSPVSTTKSTEKPPSKVQEGSEGLCCPRPAEETLLGPGTSPAPRNSPVGAMQDMCLLDIVCMNPQRISNQLHGTIAVVRPGGKPYLAETSLQTKTSPPTIQYHANHDKELRDNSPDSCEKASYHEFVKQGNGEERLCLLSQHFSHGRFSLQSPSIPADNPLSQVPKSRGTELLRRRSLNEQEEQVAVLELQGAMLYRNEQGSRRRHSISEHNERLQYFLARQHLQFQQKHRARAGALRSQNVREKGQSPPHTLWANENKKERKWSEEEWERRGPIFTYTKKCESNEKEEVSSSNHPLDQPLDLTDYGRIREVVCPTRQHKSSSSSPPSRESPASPQNTLQRGELELSLLQSSEAHAETRQLRAQDAEDFLPTIITKAKTPHIQRDKTRTRSAYSVDLGETSSSPPGDSPEYNPAGDAGIKRGKEMAALQDDEGAESMKMGSEGRDTSDSEQTGPETEQNQLRQEREYFCIKEEAQHKKRKRYNHWAKGPTKYMGRGSKKTKTAQAPVEETPGDEKEVKGSSCSEDILGET